MNAPTVLLYNLSPEKARNVKVLCLSQKLRVRAVAPEEWGLPLEALLREDRPGPEAGEGRTGEIPSGEMLLMSGLSGSQLNRFLQGFRRKKIPPVPLKAVLTASNAQWDSRRLYRELSLEHEAMLRGEAAHGPGAVSPAGQKPK